MFLVDVCKKLSEKKCEYALVGGYAVALHGAVRGTVDIDIVLRIELSNFKNVVGVLEGLGLRSTLPLKTEDVFLFREEYIKNRNLIAWNFVNSKDPSQVVDIILTTDLKKMSTVKKQVGSVTIPVLSIEDLIEMKRKSGRPQDIADIEALKRVKNV